MEIYIMHMTPQLHGWDSLPFGHSWLPIATRISVHKTATANMQEFELDSNFVTVTKVCLFGFIIFLVLGITLPFLPGEGKVNSSGVWIVSIMGTMLFGFFSVYTWKTLKKLPFTGVAIDDDGIWYIHVGKEYGLITWDKISRIKERTYLQCLDLLDSNGRRLIRVEYQLVGFEALRQLIIEYNEEASPSPSQTNFSKGWLHHLLYLTATVGFSGAGIYVGSNENPLLGYGATSVLVGFIIREYLVTATGVKIDDDNFKILYPLASNIIPISDVRTIRLVDQQHKGNKYTEVWITAKSTKKPYKIKQLGADANVLYRALHVAAKS